MDNVTYLEICFSFFIWLVFLFCCKSQINTNSTRNRSFFWFFVGLIIYSTFGFQTGDFTHYRDLYDILIHSEDPVHVEPFYYWLTKILPENYFVWRCAVWGLATIVLILIFRKLQFNATFATFIFTLVLMCYFPAPRQTLGYLVLLYGFVVAFFSDKSKTKSYVFGIILVWGSFLLHKSMFVYVLLLGISLIPFGKWTYVGSVLLFPVIRQSVYYISSFLLSSTLIDETGQESGEMYLDSDFYQIANFNGLIQLIMHRVPIILLMIWAIKKLYFTKESSTAYGYKVLLQYTYILIYISFLFYGQQASAFMSPRFWDASLYPFTVFLIFFLYKQKRTPLIKVCFYMLICANIYDFTYAFYKL